MAELVTENHKIYLVDDDGQMSEVCFDDYETEPALTVSDKINAYHILEKALQRANYAYDLSISELSSVRNQEVLNGRHPNEVYRSKDVIKAQEIINLNKARIDDITDKLIYLENFVINRITKD